jgi:hypothetical protein
MVGVIPAAVWTYYGDSSNTEKDVMYEPIPGFTIRSQEHTNSPSTRKFSPGSAEFHKNAT